MENEKLEQNNEKIEETKVSFKDKAKAFGKKFGKTMIKVGVVVAAFAAGAITDHLISGKKNSTEDTELDGEYTWDDENENEGTDENENVGTDSEEEEN